MLSNDRGASLSCTTINATQGVTVYCYSAFEQGLFGVKAKKQ